MNFLCCWERSYKLKAAEQNQKPETQLLIGTLHLLSKVVVAILNFLCRYIEFYDAMSVPMAIALSGQPLRGQAVMVKPSEAEKNLVQSTSTVGTGGAIGPYSGGARRLYVGNLHFNITEDQLRQV